MIPTCSQRVRYRARCAGGTHEAIWVSELALGGAGHTDIVTCGPCEISQELGPVMPVSSVQRMEGAL